MAASSEWIEAGGGQLRIITEDTPTDGVLRGAIEIRLEPGWKTYWRDPGEAGVPPQIGTTGSRHIDGAEILYPAPYWVDDGYAIYAAYSHSVMLPLRMRTQSDDWHLNAQVFAGVCEKICIPVQAELDVRPGRGEAADDLVASAFAALPAEAAPDLHLIGARDANGTLTVTAELPEGTSDAELFLAGAHGWYFARPQWDGGRTFTVEVYDRLDAAQGDDITWHYTLVADGRAVSGTVGLTDE